MLLGTQYELFTMVQQPVHIHNCSQHPKPANPKDLVPSDPCAYLLLGSAGAAVAVRQLEGWAKGELLGLTGKVKTVLAGCAAHQQQVNLQVRQ
jgi:hypothetical protein